MEVSATTQPAAATDADTVAVGVFADEELGEQAPPEVRALLESGEAARSPKSLALAHAAGKRWLLVGLGARAGFDPEGARVAAAVARERARELSARTLCWLAPEDAGAQTTAALVEGTLLADYRFERFKSASQPAAGGEGEDERPKHLQRLIVSSPQELDGAVAQAALVAEAANAARDLQNRPARQAITKPIAVPEDAQHDATSRTRTPAPDPAACGYARRGK